jgi:hypothetical protein
MTEVQDKKERKAVLILEVIPQPWQDMIRALKAERDNLRAENERMRAVVALDLSGEVPDYEDIHKTARILRDHNMTLEEFIRIELEGRAFDKWKAEKDADLEATK